MPTKGNGPRRSTSTLVNSKTPFTKITNTMLITILFLQIFPMNLQIILPADMRIFSFSMYGIHNDILTGTAENEKVGKDVSMPIASFPTSQGYKISNTNSLTHIRTSGNTKLIFQT